MTTENQVQFKTWMCLICGWVYDEAAGLPEEGIAPGTRWEDVPMNWTCPGVRRAQGRLRDGRDLNFAGRRGSKRLHAVN